MNPLFSIIVPVYQVERYIRKCIDSILKQDFSDFELLLIDDGSFDKCPEICDEYKKLDSRVRVYHKKNEGLVKARETGMEKARGVYIGFVDGDDWVEKGWLKEASEITYSYYPDIISFNTYLNFSNKEICVPLVVETGFYDKRALEKQIYPVMLYNKKVDFYNFGVYPSVSNKLIKKKIIWNNRCKDERITMGEDAACIYASLLEAQSLFVMEKYYYHYRQNMTSMTKAYDKNRFLKYQYLLKYMDQKLGSRGYGLDEQLKYHRAFRVKHAILNESKAEGSVHERAKELKVKMEEYGFVDAFDNLELKNTGLGSKLFIWFVRRRMYDELIRMCDVFNWLQKWK